MSYKKETRESSMGPERKEHGWSATVPLSYHYATLINREFTMVQVSGSRHTSPGESQSYPMSGKMSTK